MAETLRPDRTLSRAQGGASVMLFGRDATGMPAPVSVDASSGALPVMGPGGGNIKVRSDFAEYVDNLANLTNSGGGAEYLGPVRDRGTQPTMTKVSAVAFSDKAGTLEILQSADNSIWRTTKRATHLADAGAEISEHTLFCRYWRVRYVNTGDGSTTSLIVGSRSISQ